MDLIYGELSIRWAGQTYQGHHIATNTNEIQKMASRAVRESKYNSLKWTFTKRVKEKWLDESVDYAALLQKESSDDIGFISAHHKKMYAKHGIQDE